MQPDYSVRPALPKDSEEIYQLILELAHYEKAPEEVINTPEHIRLHGFGENPLFHAWVALDSKTDKIIGIAVCYNRYSTWKGPVLYLEDIVVTESYRRAGIGSALFEECLRFARHKGYARMSWQVLDWNEPAIKFYNKYGSTFDNEWVNCTIDFKKQSLE